MGPIPDRLGRALEPNCFAPAAHFFAIFGVFRAPDGALHPKFSRLRREKFSFESNPPRSPSCLVEVGQKVSKTGGGILILAAPQDPDGFASKTDFSRRRREIFGAERRQAL